MNNDLGNQLNTDFQFHVRKDDSLEIDHSFSGDSFFKAGIKRFFAKNYPNPTNAILLQYILSTVVKYFFPNIPLNNNNSQRKKYRPKRKNHIAGGTLFEISLFEASPKFEETKQVPPGAQYSRSGR